MENIVSKLQRIVLYSFGLAMTGVVTFFGLFVVLGALLISLVALPLGALAILVAGQTGQKSVEKEGSVATVSV